MNSLGIKKKKVATELYHYYLLLMVARFKITAMRL